VLKAWRKSTPSAGAVLGSPMMLRVSGSTICTSLGVENKAQCALNRQVAAEVIEGTEFSDFRFLNIDWNI
jgi:hypothetical protein